MTGRKPAEFGEFKPDDPGLPELEGRTTEEADAVLRVRPPLPIRVDAEQLAAALRPLVDAFNRIAENAPKLAASLERIAADLAAMRQAQQRHNRRT